MDFLFWIDLKNKIGINRITTIIGPILNVGQPIILWLIKLLYFKPNIWSANNLPITILNFAYIANMLYNYVIFISKGYLITGTKNGHLDWPWIKYSNSYFYLILFAINIFYLTDFKYSLFLFSVVYFFLYLSVKYFLYNAGELWCFFGSFIPIIMMAISYLI